MYAENHGILGNNFYNREADLEFRLSETKGNASITNPIFDWWKSVEPFWTTAINQGKGRFHKQTF